MAKRRLKELVFGLLIVGPLFWRWFILVVSTGYIRGPTQETIGSTFGTVGCSMVAALGLQLPIHFPEGPKP